MPATYIGPLAHLKGKTAHLQLLLEPEYVMAQFIDVWLTRSGNPIPHRDNRPGGTLPVDALGFGWHVFKRNEFEVTA